MQRLRHIGEHLGDSSIGPGLHCSLGLAVCQIVVITAAEAFVLFHRSQNWGFRRLEKYGRFTVVIPEVLKSIKLRVNFEEHGNARSF